MGTQALARASARDLKEKIKVAQERRDYFVRYLQELLLDYVKGKISRELYLKTEYQKFDGKTIREWVVYYNDYIRECEALISKHKKDVIRGHILTLIFSAAIIVLIAFLFSSFFELRFVGFVILSEVNGTFFDDFEDGNISDWTLTSASGANNCTASTIDPLSGSFHVECQPQSTSEPASVMEINVDTTGHENIVFSYYRKLVGLDTADEFKAMWFDGNSWNIVEETLDNSANDAAYVFKEFNLSSAATSNPNFKIRFECTAGAVSERCRLDNVTVQGGADVISPLINSASDSPDPVIVGTEIKITANITDNFAVFSSWVEINGTNHTMIQQSTLAGIEQELFEDDFELGTLNAKNWTLNSTGEFWAASSENSMNGTYHAQAHQTGAGNPSFMEVSIETSGHSNITFSYHRKLVGLDAADDFSAEWFNGVDWVAVEQLGGGSEDNTDYIFKMFNLTSTADNNPSFKIRFMCETGAVTEFCRVDNVTVEGIAFAGPEELWEYNYETVSVGTFNYRIYSNDSLNNNAVQQTGNFTVIESNITVSETVRDANETSLNTTIEILDENNTVVYNETKTTHIKEIPKGNYKVKIKPGIGRIKEINFNNLSATSDINNFIDVDNPEDKQDFDELYAVNPLINATDATITAVSSFSRNSKRIQKCEAWNFTTRECEGNWTEVMHTTAQQYSVPLDSDSSSAYGIIIITGAEHLDSNRTFISDIFNETVELDNVWSEEIPDTHYVRVDFEKNLTNKNDITIYPRITNGTPRIEIYEFNGTEIIAEFTSLISNKYNKVFLTNLNNSQDTFDLRVLDGSIEIDHIIDPTEIKWADAHIAGGFVSPNNALGATDGVWAGQLNSNSDAASRWAMENTSDSITGTQTIDVLSRKGTNSGNPTIALELWENGVLVREIVAATSITSTTGQNVTGTFNASEVINKDNVEIGVVMTAVAGGPSARNSAQVDSIRWEVNFTDNPPQWSQNSTNSTKAGESVLHSVKWTDGAALSGYIFSFDNGTGTFFNDSFVTFTGTTNFSNVTKVVNSTIGSTIRWRVYANDTTSNQNSTSIFTYTTIDAIPPETFFFSPENATTSSNFNQTFVFNFTDNVALKNSTLYIWNSSGNNIAFVEGPWNISTASYDNVNFGVLSQDTSSTGLFFKPNGTKMFIVGFENDRVHQYNLSTPWDISTASYDNVNFSVVGQTTTPQDVFFKDDGTKMYIAGHLTNGIFQYNLSSAWNLSTASYDNVNLTDDSLVLIPEDVFFKPDGTKVFVADTLAGLIYQYTLSSAWDLSTASYDNISFSPVSPPNGLFFKDDGTKMFTIGSVSVFQHTLSTAWNLSTASYDNVNFSVLSQDSSSADLFFKDDGTKTYIIGSQNDSVHQYSLKEIIFSSISGTSNSTSWNFTFEEDGTYLWNANTCDEAGNCAFNSTNYTITITSTDTTAPKWFDNTTNSTFAGQTIKHSVRWTDNVALSGYIFEFDNGTGTFANDSFVTFTGTQNFSNVSKVVNTTVGSTIRWRVYANDSSNNLNSTSIFSYNTTTANNPPTIPFVFGNATYSPTEGGSTSITFNFTARDTDGVGNLNDSTAQARFNKTGEATRSNTSCVARATSGNDKNYSCTILMYYFDGNGAWTINVTINDNAGASAENSSTSFTFNLLTAMVMSPNALTWLSPINPLDTNTGSNNDPITINNTGNSEPLSINITAYNLRGETDTGKFIFANNFTVENISEGCSGTVMVNGTSTNVTSSILQRGNNSLNFNNASSGQEQIFFCLKGIPPEATAQSYSTSFFGPWQVTILLVALIPAARRKRKKKQNRKVIENLTIPIKIFSKELGALEAIVKYMKENLGMGYSEIAEKLNRDQRTIWTAYRKSTDKQPEPLKVEKTKIFLPTSILRNRKMTILESVIVYLKLKGMKFSEIAQLLERDQRNIWTVYSKAKKKINKKEIKYIIKIGREFNVPVIIFSKELGALEAIVKYMKENLGMGYSEIAEKLNRDQRTIWTAYRKATGKQKGPFEIKETRTMVPISIFETRKLTILESMISYLKEKGLLYSEIAKLLERDQRNIWTVYSMTKKKIIDKG